MTNNEAQKIVFSVLSQDSFLLVNKKLIKKIGLIQAVVLSLFLDKHKFFLLENKDDDGWFYRTRNKMTEETGLSAYQIRQAVEILKKNGFIDIKLKGVPAKYYYKICYTKLISVLLDEAVDNKPSSEELDVKILTSRSKKIKELDIKNLTSIYNKNKNKNIYKNKNNNINFKNSQKNSIFPSTGTLTIFSDGYDINDIL